MDSTDVMFSVSRGILSTASVSPLPQAQRRGSTLTPCPFTFPGFPDPFAVATVGGEQTHTTSVIKKTLNPYWNEAFDLYVRAPKLRAQNYAVALSPSSFFFLFFHSRLVSGGTC